MRYLDQSALILLGSNVLLSFRLTDQLKWHRFYAEPYFWLQHIGISLCGLIHLGAFASLLKVRV